jgi:hypothetical protein
MTLTGGLATRIDVSWACANLPGMNATEQSPSIGFAILIKDQSTRRQAALCPQRRPDHRHHKKRWGQVLSINDKT